MQTYREHLTVLTNIDKVVWRHGKEEPQFGAIYIANNLHQLFDNPTRIGTDKDWQ